MCRSGEPSAQPSSAESSAVAPIAVITCSASAMSAPWLSRRPITVTLLRTPGSLSSRTSASLRAIRGGRKTRVRQNASPRCRRRKVTAKTCRSGSSSAAAAASCTSSESGSTSSNCVSSWSFIRSATVPNGTAVAGLLGGDEGAPARDPVDQPLGHELLVGPTDRLAAQAVLLRQCEVGGQRVVVGVALAVDALPQELCQHPVGALTVTSATNFQDLLLPPECGLALECPAIL